MVIGQNRCYNSQVCQSGGADNLDPEHMKFGGNIIHNWLLQLFSAIIWLETIPPHPEN
jgi:hypothetical protein